MIPGCELPAAPGSARCVGHPVVHLTIREQIEQGPVFVEEKPDRDGRRCACGDGTNVRDVKTGLCRACWRVWHWSPIRERGPQ